MVMIEYKEVPESKTSELNELRQTASVTSMSDIKVEDQFTIEHTDP